MAGNLHRDLHDPNLFTKNRPGEYTYGSNQYGKTASGSLKLSEHPVRNAAAQTAAGGDMRRGSGHAWGADDGGHLIGARFGGDPGEVNLTAQNRNLNRSDYKRMEDKWAQILEDGGKVYVNIETAGHDRPDAYMGYVIYEDAEGNRGYATFHDLNESRGTVSGINEEAEAFSDSLEENWDGRAELDENGQPFQYPEDIDEYRDYYPDFDEYDNATISAAELSEYEDAEAYLNSLDETVTPETEEAEAQEIDETALEDESQAQTQDESSALTEDEAQAQTQDESLSEGENETQTLGEEAEESYENTDDYLNSLDEAETPKAEEAEEQSQTQETAPVVNEAEEQTQSQDETPSATEDEALTQPQDESQIDGESETQAQDEAAEESYENADDYLNSLDQSSNTQAEESEGESLDEGNDESYDNSISM